MTYTIEWRFFFRRFGMAHHTAQMAMGLGVRSVRDIIVEVVPGIVHDTRFRREPRPLVLPRESAFPSGQEQTRRRSWRLQEDLLHQHGQPSRHLSRKFFSFSFYHTYLIGRYLRTQSRLVTLSCPTSLWIIFSLKSIISFVVTFRLKFRPRLRMYSTSVF